jgi:hypothetical protein
VHSVFSTLNNMLHIIVAKSTITLFYNDKYLESYMSQGICHITFLTPFLTRNRIMESLCANFVPFCIIRISVAIRNLYIHVYEYTCSLAGYVRSLNGHLPWNQTCSVMFKQVITHCLAPHLYDKMFRELVHHSQI